METRFTFADLENMVTEIELFKLDTSIGEIKVFKNEMLPESTVMLSPILYDNLLQHFKEIDKKQTI